MSTGLRGTVSRLVLGQHLRRLRERRGIHSRDAAAEAGMARTTLWRMEKGDTRCRFKPGDVELLGRLYKANKALTESLTDLAKTTRNRSWVKAYRDLLPEILETYIDLEAYASVIRCYSNTWVPDLLQSEDYATAQINASGTLRMVDVRRHTLIRENRQRILVREPQPAVFEFILDEVTLHRAPGTPAAMMTQMETLAALAGLASVSVRIVPLGACLYPGLQAGPFTILDFPDDEQFGRVPTTVQVVHDGEHCLLNTTTAIDRYQQWWDTTSAAALDQPASLRLIAETAGRRR